MKKLSVLILLLLAISGISSAQTTAQWRGQARDGIYPEKNLLKQWPAEGPALLWKTEIIGNGFGSPTITSDRLYITGEIDSTSYLFAFDLKGNLVWKSSCGPEWVKTFPGSRSAPTVVGDLIYVCSGNGVLACLSASDGKLKWQCDKVKAFSAPHQLHGHAEAPLVDGDKVYFVPGGPEDNVVAFNRFTGKILWTCKGVGEVSGYNAPYLIKLLTRSILVTFSAYHLMGIDAATGELLWTHEQDNFPLKDRKPGYGDTHSNTILYENGVIYYIAGDGNCAVKLALSSDGRSITQVWRNKTVDNYMGGFIKLGEKIYTCLSEKRLLVSLDAKTGQATDTLKCGAGAIIYADGLLYYYNQRGEMYLVNPGKDKMEILGTFKVTSGTKEHFSHPVIHDGTLYLRRGKALMAWDIRKK